MIKDFEKDIKKYYFEEPFDFKKIEKVVQKTLPGVVVDDFKNADPEIYFSPNLRGLFAQTFSYDAEKQIVFPGDKTLYLTAPKGILPLYAICYSKDIQERIKLADKALSYVNNVHEYTHALQSIDPEMSYIASVNEVLRKSTASKEVKENTVYLLNSYAGTVEQRINGRMIYHHENDTLLNKKYCQKKPTLDEFYADNGINDVRKFALDTMDECANELKKNNPEIDVNMLKNFAITHFKREREAYEVEFAAGKKVLPWFFNSNEQWIYSTRIQLYRTLEKLKV